MLKLDTPTGSLELSADQERAVHDGMPRCAERSITAAIRLCGWP